MQIPFTKMHGTGNIILIIDQRSDGAVAPPNPETLRRLGDQGTGPGFDQLLWLTRASDETSLAGYRVFNADGSEVEQCGNGVRCIARYLAGTESPDREFSLQSPAGPILARVFQNGGVAVSMGTPRLEPAALPFEAEHAARSYELAVGDQKLEISAVSMGNPHAVLLVDDVNMAPVSDLGAQIERHQRFPNRTNVGFMHVRSRQSIDLRVFERGVGETRACGTGACAAVVAGQRLDLLDEEVNVRLPGGEVMVSWRGGRTPVWLSGDAVVIDTGMLEL